MSAYGVCEWLEATPVAQLVKDTPWGFQVLAAIHIMGVALSVGTLVWFDLRLLGVAMPGCRLSVLYRQLLPWSGIGFLVMVATGLLLFAGTATASYVNVYFRIKLVALALAAGNALVYHRITARSIVRWDALPHPPFGARMAGMVSIVLWMSVVIAGRIISLTLY